mmetsp:Transcript_54445/g.173012  ORF Transcript_54445/g.173012 Transcript_54445/m.173012 type:complete len:125 (+) Transcript_54445:697-1071(+)
MAAAATLLKGKLDANVVECCCVLEILDLGGRGRIQNAGFSLFSAAKVPITHSEIRTRGERLTKIDSSHGRNSMNSEDSYVNSPTHHYMDSPTHHSPMQLSSTPPLQPLLEAFDEVIRLLPPEEQ